MGVFTCLQVYLLISTVHSLVIGYPNRTVISHVPTDFSADINGTGTNSDMNLRNRSSGSCVCCRTAFFVWKH